MARASKWRIKPGVREASQMWIVYTPEGKGVAIQKTAADAMEYVCRILRHPAASLLRHSFSPRLDEYLSAVKSAP